MSGGDAVNAVMSGNLLSMPVCLAAQGRYTDAVDDVLCKVLEAKKKKLKIEYI